MRMACAWHVHDAMLHCPRGTSSSTRTRTSSRRARPSGARSAGRRRGRARATSAGATWCLTEISITCISTVSPLYLTCISVVSQVPWRDLGERGADKAAIEREARRHRSSNVLHPMHACVCTCPCTCEHITWTCTHGHMDIQHVHVHVHVHPADRRVCTARVHRRAATASRRRPCGRAPSCRRRATHSDRNGRACVPRCCGRSCAAAPTTHAHTTAPIPSVSLQCSVHHHRSRRCTVCAPQVLRPLDPTAHLRSRRASPVTPG